jgi:hypothetical protein
MISLAATTAAILTYDYLTGKWRADDLLSIILLPILIVLPGTVLLAAHFWMRRPEDAVLFVFACVVYGIESCLVAYDMSRREAPVAMKTGIMLALAVHCTAVPALVLALSIRCILFASRRWGSSKKADD